MQTATMATQYSSLPTTAAPPSWYEKQRTQQSSTGELRSVTPAMNNTRGVMTNPSRAGGGAAYPSRVPSPAPNLGGAGAQQQTQSNVGAHYAGNGRSATPNRYYGAFNSQEHLQAQQNAGQQQPQQHSGPSSTGLIRLTLRKPMGIVFEPMYDPNQPSVQRGVRICDLPRTGAAALSRKLEVGDELLSINDKTMSRLTFDEIMDFIIEADPEQVNLLFRRPRKETLAARTMSKAPSSTNNASVKWVDDDHRKKKEKMKEEKNSSSQNKSSSNNRSKRSSKQRDEEDTLVSEDDRDKRSSRSRKSSRRHYQNESFLDMLIDTLCANPDAVCKNQRMRDDDFYSDEEDDRTLTSQDDSTYVTYDDSERMSKGLKTDESSVEDTEDDTFTSEDDRRRRKLLNKKKLTPPVKKQPTPKQKEQKQQRTRQSQPKPQTKPRRDDDQEEKKEDERVAKKPYEDDSTLETTGSIDRPNPAEPATTTPLGLAPEAAAIVSSPSPKPVPVPEPPVPESDDDGANPAPIAEVEYDDGVDHGADVSVMESLGGPSLLIEKQRQAALAKTEGNVPSDIVNKFGLDFPVEFGLSREQTIQKDPMRFYTFVVKQLLEEHEPEKVRLLDKLLTKYKGREDHLIQKLSVRYNKRNQEESKNPTPPIPEEQHDAGFGTFTDAVNTKKESAATAAAIETAKERAEATFGQWPKEEGDEDERDEDLRDEDEASHSESASEFSGDSIDGTSPAVIAQVSELLNYVYGKTSVPGQIDRVSTIMRAYEGREAVLLELLETKALIKANSEKENTANLPSFLRNSPALQSGIETAPADEGEEPVSVSPLSSPNMPNSQQNPTVGGGNLINDDISSMSGVSSPVLEPKGEQSDDNLRGPKRDSPAPDQNSGPMLATSDPSAMKSGKVSRRESSEAAPIPGGASTSTSTLSSHPPPNSRNQMKDVGGNKKKKKGLFGGLFAKKGKKVGTGKKAVQRGKVSGKVDFSSDGSI